jgi:hypothetical protein
VREFLVLLQEQWATLRLEPQDFVDAGDDVVVPFASSASAREAASRRLPTLRTSGPSPEQDRSTDDLQTMAEALEAAGIEG